MAGLALLAGCQLVLDFSPLADGGAPDAGVIDGGGGSDAADLCAELEPNNSLATALAIEAGPLQAAVCPAGDDDFYGFELTGSEDMAIDLTFEQGANDLELALYDVAAIEVLTISTGTDGDERIERSEAVSGRLPAGSYAVRVFGRDDDVQNPYELVLSLGVPPRSTIPDRR